MLLKISVGKCCKTDFEFVFDNEILLALYKLLLVLYNLLMRLILASNSPRRKELLKDLGYPFEVIPAMCDEITSAQLPRDIVAELACNKALNVYLKNKDSVVIGCDTVVDLDGDVLGKPKDRIDAENMLTSLSARTHKVHTGVCVVCKNGVYLFCVTSDVKFKNLSKKQILDYIDSGSPMDKAGAYGIQDSGFVDSIDGSYTNVMGFPVDEIKSVLQKIYKR